MDQLTEPSSSLSFTSSSYLSNNSVNNHLSGSPRSDSGTVPEVISLSKLSASLELLLSEAGLDYSDADIVVEDKSVGVHRCVLAARSEFFHYLFKKESGFSEKEKPKYCMKDLLPYGDVGYEAFLIFLSYVYTGKLKPFPMEVSTCVDDSCCHDACRPKITFAVELLYASYIFQIRELVSLLQRLLHTFLKAAAEDIVPILLVAFHCRLKPLVKECVDKVVQSDIDSVSLEKELPQEVSEEIRLLRLKYQLMDEKNSEVVNPSREKSIRRIHRALDSDDVELVKLLLSESGISLDDAKALHYAAAYCDPKVVSELLALGSADVNLRNSRGFTVLHVAAMRKEPKVIMSLIEKGARASELTLDGRSAVGICRRLTRPKDYHAKGENGLQTNKDRICIDVLEREMCRAPSSVVTSVSGPIDADDLHMKLLYLENRVAFARLFFPAEAKLAMDIAHAGGTREFAGLSLSGGSSKNLREVDLNETPLMQLRSRVEALQRTVDKGRRFFPHCSEVLDKFMDDDLPDLCYLEKGTTDEQRIKTERFMELKDEVHKAFSKDKAKLNRCILSTSSASSSLRDGMRLKSRR